MDLVSLVIKVKYGDEASRRFRLLIKYEKLEHAMQELKDKIVSLFEMTADEAEDLSLTYVDKDGDVVGLVNADDLLDAVEQGLNPLRVTVEHPHSITSESEGDGKNIVQVPETQIDYEFYFVFGGVMIPAYAFCFTLAYKILTA